MRELMKQLNTSILAEDIVKIENEQPQVYMKGIYCERQVLSLYTKNIDVDIFQEWPLVNVSQLLHYFIS